LIKRGILLKKNIIEDLIIDIFQEYLDIHPEIEINKEELIKKVLKKWKPIFVENKSEEINEKLRLLSTQFKVDVFKTISESLIED